jgi:hypothetical protein
MLTQERLKELYTFDQDTGHFRYLSKSRTRRRGVGAVAGSLSKQMGYVLVGVDGPQYLAHRLAWLYMTGAWPDAEVDHIDGNRANNAWSNLRLASRSQNIANSGLRVTNTTGFKGVFKARKKFNAKITVNYKSVNLGNFDTKEEASAAYKRAAQAAFGEFARV